MARERRGERQTYARGRGFVRAREQRRDLFRGFDKEDEIAPAERTFNKRYKPLPCPAAGVASTWLARGAGDGLGLLLQQPDRFQEQPARVGGRLELAGFELVDEAEQVVNQFRGAENARHQRGVLDAQFV